MIGPKPRAIEVTLSNGTVVFVHSPTMAEFTIYLRALPSIQALIKAVTSMGGEEGTLGVIDLPDSVMNNIIPLLSRMTVFMDGDNQVPLSAEEYASLPYDDGMTILTSFISVLPKNPEAAPTGQDSTISKSTNSES